MTLSPDWKGPDRPRAARASFLSAQAPTLRSGARPRAAGRMLSKSQLTGYFRASSVVHGLPPDAGHAPGPPTAAWTIRPESTTVSTSPAPPLADSAPPHDDPAPATSDSAPPLTDSVPATH